MVNRFSRRKAEDETKLSWEWDVSAEEIRCKWKLSVIRGGVRTVKMEIWVLRSLYLLIQLPSIQLTAAMALWKHIVSDG